MKARISIVLPVLAALLAGPAVGSAADKDAEEKNRTVLEMIVARVNNDIITLSEFTQSRQLLRRELAQQYRGAELEKKFEEGEKNLLRDLIDQRLLVQRGLDMGLSVEADVIKRLDRIRQENNLNSLEELERMVQSQGTSFEDFKQRLREQMITNMVIQREVSGRVFIDAEKVREYYLTHQDELHQPERVRLREILISTEGFSPSELPAREQRVREVLAKIRSGEPFEELAKTYSDAPTAADGGELGYLEPAKLAPTYREIINSLLDGGVSDPQRTREGWLILQKVEYLAPGLPPYAEIEDRLREKLYYDEVQPALRDFLSDMRREAYVKVATGYVDAGAVEEEATIKRRRGSARRGKSRRRPD